MTRDPAPGGRLDEASFGRGAQEVAPDLLGHVLCHRVGRRVQRARIVETEAYVGEHDLACHAARGRTPRTEVLYGPPGRAYVYFVYGMHHLLNAVCAPEDDPQAVLIRAVAPLTGIDGRTDGPGRLTARMGITTAGHNRLDLRGDRLWIERGVPPSEVTVGPRIGVDYAAGWAAAPLRFWDAESTHVSRPRQAAPS